MSFSPQQYRENIAPYSINPLLTEKPSIREDSLLLTTTSICLLLLIQISVRTLYSFSFPLIMPSSLLAATWLQHDSSCFSFKTQLRYRGLRFLFFIHAKRAPVSGPLTFLVPPLDHSVPRASQAVCLSVCQSQLKCYYFKEIFPTHLVHLPIPQSFLSLCSALFSSWHHHYMKKLQFIYPFFLHNVLFPLLSWTESEIVSFTFATYNPRTWNSAWHTVVLNNCL